MNLFGNLFAWRPNASDAARALSAKRWKNEREQKLAVARQICDELGKSYPEGLCG